MEKRKILKVINAFPSDLTKEERKIQILALWMLIPFYFILSYVWFGILMKLNFILIFLAFCTISLGMTVMVYYWDELDEKYGLKPIKSPFNLSYQGFVILLTCWIITLFFLGLALGLTTNNIWFGLGGAVATVYPVVLMFLRIETFSDDSILISEKVILPATDNKRSGVPRAALPNINFSREVTETKEGFGYMPLAYWTLSAIFGLYVTGTGFSDIHWYFVKGSPSLGVAIFTIVLGLVVQSVYLFPDKLNKIVPIELRTKKGFWFMMIILPFVLFGISQLLIGIVTGLTA